MGNIEWYIYSLTVMIRETLVNTKFKLEINLDDILNSIISFLNTTTWTHIVEADEYRLSIIIEFIDLILLKGLVEVVKGLSPTELTTYIKSYSRVYDSIESIRYRKEDTFGSYNPDTDRVSTDLTELFKHSEKIWNTRDNGTIAIEKNTWTYIKSIMDNIEKK
jgi:predicted P-loop ATPase